MYLMAHRCVAIMNVKSVGTVSSSLTVRPQMVCPACGEQPDMEIGPDEPMPVIEETAKLLQVIQGEDEVEKMDTLLSLAVTGGNEEWL